MNVLEAIKNNLKRDLNDCDIIFTPYDNAFNQLLEYLISREKMQEEFYAAIIDFVEATTEYLLEEKGEVEKLEEHLETILRIKNEN